MPIVVDRIDEIGINVLIWVGRVSRADALEMPGKIDPARPEFGRRWISHFDSSADLSDLDPECLLQLRERLRSVVAALAAKGEFRMILASNSTYNDPLLAAWRTMVATDADYRSNPVLVRDIDMAARALGLSASDAERTRVWIETRVERCLRKAFERRVR